MPHYCLRSKSIGRNGDSSSRVVTFTTRKGFLTFIITILCVYGCFTIASIASVVDLNNISRFKEMDDFNPTLTTPKPSKASDEKSRVTSTENLTENIGWDHYQLGDYVLMNMAGEMEVHPSSIAAEYKILSTKTYGNTQRYRKDIFCDIVKRRGRAGLAAVPPRVLPDPGDVVVHLRMGDVLDNTMQPEEVEDVWNYGVSIVPLQIRDGVGKHTLGWWNYTKSKCFYSIMLAQLPANTTMKRVVIIGSSIHNTRQGSKKKNSLIFSGLVRSFFEGEGYNVKVRLNGLPDDDMVWMSHASAFVCAGGRFSKLAHECASYFGGTTFKQNLGWDKGLDEACGKAPRPEIKMRNYTWEKLGWKRDGVPWNGKKTFPPDELVW